MMLEEYAEREFGTRDLEEGDRRAAVLTAWQREQDLLDDLPRSDPHRGREADDVAAVMVRNIMDGLEDGGRDD